MSKDFYGHHHNHQQGATCSFYGCGDSENTKEVERIRAQSNHSRVLAWARELPIHNVSLSSQKPQYLESGFHPGPIVWNDAATAGLLSETLGPASIGPNCL
jgi:hypothetical protein